MLAQDRNVVVYGAAGHIGSAVARAFAREGAQVFLTGRTLAGVQRVAASIVAEGGRAAAAQVDALDGAQIARHLDDVMQACRAHRRQLQCGVDPRRSARDAAAGDAGR